VPIQWPPIFYDAAYYLSYGEYLARYGYWWAQQHQTSLIAGGALGAAGLIGLGVAAVRGRRSDSDTWGSARWAEEGEIERAGLFAQGSGIILGRYGAWWHQRLLCSADDTHVAVFGPTGQLKTWSLIIPTLLNWMGSVIVLDIKGELHQLTSGFRSMLGPVYRFNPSGAGGIGLNPLGFIRADQEIADAQRLAEATTSDPDASADSKSEYWRDQVADWLVTLFMYARRSDGFAQHLAGILGFLRQTSNRKQMLQTMSTCADPEVQAGARRLLGITAPGRLDEIWDGAIRVLSLWRDPQVAKATETLDVSMERFQQEAYPQTLYLQVTAEDLSGRLRSLFRMIVDQLISRLIARQVGAYVQSLLIVLDEVSSLGYMAIVERLCALLRGYGIRVVLAFHSVNDVWAKYTHNSRILDNCQIKLVYEPSNSETAKSMVSLFGDATVQEVTTRKHGARFALMYDGAGTQTISHRRDLVTAGELMELGKYRELIRVNGTEYGLKPIQAMKLRYRDRAIRDKLLPEVA
jgi:type IV secretion system protein VirD4